MASGDARGQRPGRRAQGTRLSAPLFSGLRVPGHLLRLSPWILKRAEPAAGGWGALKQVLSSSFCFWARLLVRASWTECCQSHQHLVGTVQHSLGALLPSLTRPGAPVLPTGPENGQRVSPAGAVAVRTLAVSPPGPVARRPLWVM